MIDVDNETLVEVIHAPREFPSIGGRRPHKATVYRWCTRGVRGVKLETLLIGGTLCTSVEAIRRFILATSQRKAGAAEELTRTPAQRRRASERAARELEKLGV